MEAREDVMAKNCAVPYDDDSVNEFGLSLLLLALRCLLFDKVPAVYLCIMEGGKGRVCLG